MGPSAPSEAEDAQSGNSESTSDKSQKLFFTDRTGTKGAAKPGAAGSINQGRKILSRPVKTSPEGTHKQKATSFTADVALRSRAEGPAGALGPIGGLGAFPGGNFPAASGAVPKGSAYQNRVFVAQPGASPSKDNRSATLKRPRGSSPNISGAPRGPRKKQSVGYRGKAPPFLSPKNANHTPLGVNKCDLMDINSLITRPDDDGAEASNQGLPSPPPRQVFYPIHDQRKHLVPTPSTPNSYLAAVPQLKSQDVKSARKAREANQAYEKSFGPYKPVIDYDKEIKETIAAIISLRQRYENHRKMMIASDVQQPSKDNWDRLQDECSQVPRFQAQLTSDAMPLDPATEADRLLDEIAADMARTAAKTYDTPAPITTTAPVSANIRTSAKAYQIAVHAWEKSKNTLNRWERCIELRKAVDDLSVHLIELRAEKRRDTKYCNWLRKKRFSQLDAGRKHEDLSGDDDHEVLSCRWDDDDTMPPFAGVGVSE